MKRNKRNTGRSAKKNDRYSCREIDTAWFDGANYESNSIIHGAFGQVCSRIFSSRIKGRRARWGLRSTRRPTGLDLRTGPRRTFILSSLNVSFCQRPVWTAFLRSTFDPRFSPLVSMRDNLCVYALFTGEEKIIKIIGGYRETCRRCYCMIYLKFLRENQGINFDWLLCFYEINSYFEFFYKMYTHIHRWEINRKKDVWMLKYALKNVSQYNNSLNIFETCIGKERFERYSIQCPRVRKRGELFTASKYFEKVEEEEHGVPWRNRWKSLEDLVSDNFEPATRIMRRNFDLVSRSSYLFVSFYQTSREIIVDVLTFLSRSKNGIIFHKFVSSPRVF